MFCFHFILQLSFNEVFFGNCYSEIDLCGLMSYTCTCVLLLGVDSPRTESSSGGILPSTRNISVKLFGDRVNEFDQSRSVMHMTFGQFLDHDITRTAGW